MKAAHSEYEFMNCRAGSGLHTTIKRSATLRASHPVFAADLDGDQKLSPAEWTAKAQDLYAGMPMARTIILVVALSGALAGLAGMSEVAGIGHQLQRNLSPGYGYAAIIVAWLARLHPIGAVLVAFLLAALTVGGDQLQMSLGLPAAIAPMLQGTILFFLLGGDILTRYRLIKRTPALAAVARENEPA